MNGFWGFVEKNTNEVVALSGVAMAAIGGTVGWLTSRYTAAQAGKVDEWRLQLEGWKLLGDSYGETITRLRDRLDQVEIRLAECEVERKKLWAELERRTRP